MIGAVLAFCAGAAISAVNYALSRYVLKKYPNKYMAAQIIRQLIQVTYLVLLYVFGGYSIWDKSWLLVGGCIGITLPMFWFTYRLVKLNDSLHGKEESTDGGRV